MGRLGGSVLAMSRSYAAAIARARSRGWPSAMWGPGQSIARREYRHRDAGHVPPGEDPRTAGRGHPNSGNEAPEATVRAGDIDAISAASAEALM
jgi:hypothetical protein